MPTTVGQHPVSTYTTPQNGDANDADVVRGHLNILRDAYVAHDADGGIHVESGAALPGSAVAGDKFILTGDRSLYIYSGVLWQKVTGMPFNDTGRGFPFAFAQGDVSGLVALNWLESSTIQIRAVGAITGFTHSNLGSRGDTYTLVIEQGGAGMNTIDVTTLQSDFRWGLGGVPDLATGLGTKSVIRAYYDGTDLLASCPTRGA